MLKKRRGDDVGYQIENLASAASFRHREAWVDRGIAGYPRSRADASTNPVLVRSVDCTSTSVVRQMA